MRAFLLVALVACGPGAAPRDEPAPVVLDAAPEAASAAPDAALPPGCRRLREAFQGRCSGVPPRPGEPDGTPVKVCDDCLADGDCAAQPGGRCVNVGGHPCSGPAHLACRYPSAECGGGICPEPELPYPPSAPPGR